LTARIGDIAKHWKTAGELGGLRETEAACIIDLVPVDDCGLDVTMRTSRPGQETINERYMDEWQTGGTGAGQCEHF
jgi:hypothetical protein